MRYSASQSEVNVTQDETKGGQTTAGAMLDRDGVFELVRSTMIELGLCPADVLATAELFDELDLDSLDWVDLATRLEELLPLSLRDENLDGIRTVDDVADRIHTRLLESGGTRT